ncbi:MAG TPA: pectate lyase [Ferruginibacter sp.]|nr:pectate lyase [Ferruginibacter sp.]HMP21231.1 pectate lyase [Ferruginibacter sp.]
MKKLNVLACAVTAVILFSCKKDSGTTPTPPPPAEEQIVAFPGAEGFGRFTSGGRGGQVIYVDKLTDVASEPGTLRYAINRTGRRIIVFKVSGTITLANPLEITNGNITIAGQTAPGDGITLRNYPLIIKADNVIVRFMRFRLGDINQEREYDSFEGQGRKNILIDHCSMSWSVDECASFYRNQNFTLQWSIISESLNKSFHGKEDHGYGGIWGGSSASFHHNLLAHHQNRNPRFDGGNRAGTGALIPSIGLDKVDYRNNVVYNWASNTAYGGENGQYNMINNYLKPGPATPSSRRARILEIYMENGAAYAPGFGKFYVDGNFVEGSTAATTNNWDETVKPIVMGSGLSTANFALAKLTAPITAEAVTTHTAASAYNKVLLYSGSSLSRDAVDTRVVSEVQNGTTTYNGSKTGLKGIIDSQSDVGGWPALATQPAPVDTDLDGIPDAWETARGLNPNSYADGSAKTLDTKLTNVEVYLNSLVEHIITEKLKP